MRCVVCKKDGDEVSLFEGIFNAEMVMVCEVCAEIEGIPLIRKPSQNQIDRSQKSYSVRERMERMSGMRKNTTPVSDDQVAVQGNLARLKIPDPKQTHPDVLDNYYWQVNMARRRKKLTLKQMSEQVGVSVDVLDDVEKGKIPQDFELLFPKLEQFLGVKLLKLHPAKITMHRRNRDEEKEILEEVKRRMEESDSADEVITHEADTVDLEEIDFSRRENLKDITLNDLVERKRKKDQQKKKKEEKTRHDALLGDDIDLEFD